MKRKHKPFTHFELILMVVAAILIFSLSIGISDGLSGNLIFKSPEAEAGWSVVLAVVAFVLISYVCFKHWKR